MVREHYARLGFTFAGPGPDGSVRSTLELARFVPFEAIARVEAA